MRNGIVSSGMERVAAREPPQRQPASRDDAVSFDRLFAILTACRQVSTGRWEHGRHQPSIRVHSGQCNRFHADDSSVSRLVTLGFDVSLDDDPAPGPTPDRAARLATARAMLENVVVAVGGRAMSTTSYPGLRSFASPRTASRTRRLTRLRHTALPTRFPTTMANREGAWSPRGLMIQTSSGCAQLVRLARTR